MARIRTLKPEFFTSPSTAAVSFPVRILYQAMWCAADDFGVGETNFNALLGLAFPDSDGVTCADLRGFCADCARNFQTIFYEVRGRYYYAIPSWEKHQKLEKRSERRRFPPPDDPDATPDLRIYLCADSAPEGPRKSGAESGGSLLEQGNRGTGEQGNLEREKNSLVPLLGRGVTGGETEKKPRRKAPRTQLPDGWHPDPEAIQRMREQYPHLDLKAECEAFTNHHQAHGNDMADWTKAFWTWLGNTNKFGPNGKTSGNNGKAPHKMRVLAELAQKVRAAENAAQLTTANLKELQ